MCTLAGAAGPIDKLSSKLKAEFHEFLSCLFTMAELRGRDAAGFWVWRGNHYVYEKRPYSAEDLIERSPRWKGLRFNPGSLYLMHTRSATDGDPNENINNHPHMGKHSVMVHNGMVWGHQAIANKFALEMKTDCDSEVLLRLAECVDDIKDGMKFMYESTSNTTDSIVTAFVDRRSPDRIYLSRNTGNPCYLYESKRFGCTFFCSTEDIFERALKLLYHSKSPKIIGAKSVDVCPNWLYHLHADGSVEKEFLVQQDSYYSSGTSSYEYDDEDEVAFSAKHYVKVLLGSRGMSVNLAGRMELLAESEEEEIEEDNADLEFMESIAMSPAVENELRRFLDVKIEEGIYQ